MLMTTSGGFSVRVGAKFNCMQLEFAYISLDYFIKFLAMAISSASQRRLTVASRTANNKQQFCFLLGQLEAMS